MCKIVRNPILRATVQKLETLQNELLETRSKFEEERTAKNEEVELIIADLDRANHRAEAAAKESEELRARLMQQGENAARSKGEADGDQSRDQSSVITGLEAELTRKEREISQLSSDLTATEDKNAIEVNQLNRQVSGKRPVRIK